MGGKILIGVDDNGNIIGTDTSNNQRANIQNQISQIEPRINVKIEVVDNVIVENAYKNFLKLSNTSETIEREELLINLNFLEKVNDKYMFTNAGVIFFAKNPTKFLIQNYITCIAFKETNRVYILDTIDCNKDIITNINDKNSRCVWNF